jgi:hypothetical protein
VNSLTPTELARRVRRDTGLRLDTDTAQEFLWAAQGIAEQIDGRWRLTKHGRAMFGGYAHTALYPQQEAAA